MECDLEQNESKVETIVGIHFGEFYGCKQFWKCSKTIPNKSLVDEFNMHWNVNLKESNESSRSWSSL
jgi:hypothetical protein